MVCFRAFLGLYLLFLCITACGVASDSKETEGWTEAQQTAMSPEARLARAQQVAPIVRNMGIENVLAVLGILQAESGLAHCYHEWPSRCATSLITTQECVTDSNPQGALVLSGTPAEGCGSSVGITQVDEGSESYLLERYQNTLQSVGSLEGNIRLGIGDKVLAKLADSVYSPKRYVHEKGVEITAKDYTGGLLSTTWINAIPLGNIENTSYKNWLEFLAYFYNGCGDQNDCQIIKDRYHQATLVVIEEFKNLFTNAGVESAGTALCDPSSQPTAQGDWRMRNGRCLPSCGQLARDWGWQRLGMSSKESWVDEAEAWRLRCGSFDTETLSSQVVQWSNEAWQYHKALVRLDTSMPFYLDDYQTPFVSPYDATHDCGGCYLMVDISP